MYKYIRGLAFCSFIFLISCAHADVVQALTVQQFGGSDFVTIGLDPMLLHGDQSWQDSNVFRTPSCQYNTQTTAVDQQLELMRQNGQKKLGLMLWFAHMDKPVDCRGFLLNSSGGRLTPQVLSNLQSLVRKVGTLGFDEVQIRFAPMANNRPEQWHDWDQAMFDENWAVIDSTITALSQVGGVHLVYDLSVELGGLHGNNQIEPYVQRLWAAYTRKFSVDNSYGFSIAMAPGRTRQLLQDLTSVGPLPSEIAIDTYDVDHPGIRVAAEEMHAQGVNVPILVQETLYNNSAMYAALLKQARDNHVQIKAIMQWPLTEGHKTHISETETPNYIYQSAP